MGRTPGARNRKAKDRGPALRKWLERRKAEQSAVIGCELCPEGGRVHDPRRLRWWHRDQAQREFRIADGPTMAHMTQEKLKAEVDKCMLVCHRHFHSWVLSKKYTQGRRNLDPSECPDLEPYLVDEAGEPLFPDGVPDLVRIGGAFYVKDRPK